MDTFNEEKTACKFWVVGLPKQFFSDTNFRSEFEIVFHEYGAVEFQYLCGLERLLVSYKTAEQAAKAIEELPTVFRGTNVRICPIRPVTIGSSTLGPPARTKQFLISPPTSPPVGWAPVQEEAPSVDYNLLAALSRLRMGGEQTELYHGTNNTPSIIVTNDDEDDDQGMDVQDKCFDNDFQESSPSLRISALPSSVVHTPRPPLHS